MFNQEWTPSKKQPHEYKVTTLPRGNEKSHLDFVPAFVPGRAAYGRKKSKEQMQKEAFDKLAAAERKAMKAELPETTAES
mgnify:CR=1 FL=1